MSCSAVLCGVSDVSKFFCHCGSGPPGLSVFWGDLGLLSWLSEVLFRHHAIAACLGSPWTRDGEHFTAGGGRKGCQRISSNSLSQARALCVLSIRTGPRPAPRSGREIKLAFFTVGPRLRRRDRAAMAGCHAIMQSMPPRGLSHAGQTARCPRRQLTTRNSPPPPKRLPARRLRQPPAPPSKTVALPDQEPDTQPVPNEGFLLLSSRQRQCTQCTCYPSIKQVCTAVQTHPAAAAAAAIRTGFESKLPASSSRSGIPQGDPLSMLTSANPNPTLRQCRRPRLPSLVCGNRVDGALPPAPSSVLPCTHFSFLMTDSCFNQNVPP